MRLRSLRRLATRVSRGAQGAAAVVRHAAKDSRHTGRPEVFIDIRRAVNTRTWAQIVLLFDLSGYRPRLRLRSLRQLRSIASLLGYTRDFSLAFRRWRGGDQATVRVDDQDDELEPKAEKRVRLRYDYGPHASVGAADYMMPFILHPDLYKRYPALQRLNEFRGARRTIRILFSGNFDQAAYDSPLLRDRFGKLPRFPIIDYLRSTRLSKIVTSGEELSSLLEGDYHHGFVLIDTARYRISGADWLHVLSKADFALCPPGFLMPMCHNAIESMAVGTVPVTNYADWFFPRLVHGTTCIEFSDTTDLHQRMEEVLAMPDEQVNRMRARVADYHDEHLSLPRLALRLLNDPAQTVTLHVLDGTDASLRKSMNAGTGAP